METSATTGQIAAALAKAHIEIDNPELDGVNPHFKSRFSTLAAVLNAVRKPLAKHGIALLQSVAIEDGRVRVSTNLMHASGEWLRETMSFPLAGGSNVQQAGSVVTYLRRYSLIALCGIVGDPHQDDDGDDDRLQHEEKRNGKPAAKPAPRKETTAAEPPRKETNAFPPAPKKPGRPWPDSGAGEMQVGRVVTRDGGKTAALCEAEDGTSAWVCVPDALLGAVKEDTLVEMDYAWNKAGFYEAVRVSPAKAEAAAQAAEEVPF
jgi:hypothetical protein